MAGQRKYLSEHRKPNAFQLYMTGANRQTALRFIFERSSFANFDVQIRSLWRNELCIAVRFLWLCTRAIANNQDVLTQ